MSRDEDLAWPRRVRRPRGAGYGPATPSRSAPAVDVVRLDVSVLDKDRRPVRDLDGRGFRDHRGRRGPAIVAFDAVVMPPREEPTAPWMRDVAPDVKTNALGEPRLFVVIMDDAQTPLNPWQWSITLQHDRPRPSWKPLAVGPRGRWYSPRTTSGAQDFTSDRALLMAADRDLSRRLDTGNEGA